MADEYFLYAGKKCDDPQYDGEHRYGAYIRRDMSPRDPHELGDSIWKWATVGEFNQDNIFCDKATRYDNTEYYLCGTDARREDNLSGITQYGRCISVPIVGHVNWSYGNAHLSIGSWQAVRDDKYSTQLAEARCYWDDARRKFGDLPRQELYEKAMDALEQELKFYEEFIEWGAYAFVICDVIENTMFKPWCVVYGKPEDNVEQEAKALLEQLQSDPAEDAYVMMQQGIYEEVV